MTSRGILSDDPLHWLRWCGSRGPAGSTVAEARQARVSPAAFETHTQGSFDKVSRPIAAVHSKVTREGYNQLENSQEIADGKGPGTTADVARKYSVKLYSGPLGVMSCPSHTGRRCGSSRFRGDAMAMRMRSNREAYRRDRRVRRSEVLKEPRVTDWQKFQGPK